MPFVQDVLESLRHPGRAATVLILLIPLAVGCFAALLLRRRGREARAWEGRFRAVVEHAPEAIVVVEGHTGRLRTVNGQACRLVGRDEADLLGRTLLDLSPARQPDGRDSAAEAGRLLGRALSGADAVAEWLHLRPDGTEVPCEIRMVALPGAGALVRVSITDRRERERTEQALRESEERYRLLVEHSPEPIAVYSGGRVAYANAAAARLVGAAAPSEVMGRAVSAFVPAGSVRRQPRRVRAPGQRSVTIVEDRVRRLDGTVVQVEAVTTRVSFRGRPAVQVVLRDLSGRQRADERLLHDARHDPLTRLPNRTYFRERLESAIRNRRRGSDGGFAVLFLDLDRFKVVNDSLGHLKGDELLVVLSARLLDCVREGDVVARIGGDEFAVLAPEVEDAADAQRLADRMLAGLSAPVALDGHEISVSGSIGIALSVAGYDRPEDMLRDADTAMYRAKARGAGGHELFDREMHAQAMALLRIESDMRRGVERNEFRVHYQPIISLETGGLEGFEALLRWEHPELGLIAPASFIEVAEETGLIVPMGWRVLDEACMELRRWQARVDTATPLGVHVNLSGRQLIQADLPGRVEEILRTCGCPPEGLRVEVTENVLMRDAAAAAETLVRLKALGISICIDDFGTGYSSLSYLHRFPVDVIKVDRSFVSGGPAGGGVNWDITRAIVRLGHDLGKRVIAEGVETPEQLGALRALGTPAAQGFIFSHPLEPGATHALLARWGVGRARVPARHGLRVS